MQPSESGLAQQLLEHQAFLQRLARALVGADADDLVQDVWQRALANPPRHPLKLRGWIARIARNLAADRRRGELRRKEHEAEVARPVRLSDGPHSRAARFELHRELVGILAALDEPYRDMLLMRYFEGLLPEEIGKREGLPTATVKTRLRRGLDQLRAELDRNHPGGREAWLPAATLLAGRPISAALSGAGGMAIGGIAMTKAWIGAAAVLAAVLGAIFLLRDIPAASTTAASAAATDQLAKPGPEGREVYLLGPERANREPVAFRAPSRIKSPVGSDTISGRVIDDTGKAIEGATVTAKLQTNAEKESVQQVTSGPGGRFAIQRCRLNGSYELKAELKGYWFNEPISCQAGIQDAELILLRSGTIRGRIIEALGSKPSDYVAVVRYADWAERHRSELESEGEPEPEIVVYTNIPHARSILVRQEQQLDGDAATKVGPDGSFELANLQPGPATVLIAVDDRKQSLVEVCDVDVQEGRVCTDKRLNPVDINPYACMYDVGVVDAEGQWVGNSYIEINASDDPRSRFAVSCGSDRARFVAPLRVATITAMAPGYDPVTVYSPAQIITVTLREK
jgi:RNA polymerase sigma factor (sigma-70 family)